MAFLFGNGCQTGRRFGASISLPALEHGGLLEQKLQLRAILAGLTDALLEACPVEHGFPDLLVELGLESIPLRSGLLGGHAKGALHPALGEEGGDTKGELQIQHAIPGVGRLGCEGELA